MQATMLKLKAWVFRTYGILHFHATGNWSEQDKQAAINLDTAVKLYEQGAIFIDVRSPDEWSKGSVRRAMFARSGNMENVEPKPSRSTPVVTFCEAGDRARRAAGRLRSQGYSNVYFLWPGGYLNWAISGLPIAD